MCACVWKELKKTSFISSPFPAWRNSPELCSASQRRRRGCPPFFRSFLSGTGRRVCQSVDACGTAPTPMPMPAAVSYHSFSAWPRLSNELTANLSRSVADSRGSWSRGSPYGVAPMTTDARRRRRRLDVDGDVERRAVYLAFGAACGLIQT